MSVKKEGLHPERFLNGDFGPCSICGAKVQTRHYVNWPEYRRWTKLTGALFIMGLALLGLSAIPELDGFGPLAAVLFLGSGVLALTVFVSASNSHVKETTVLPDGRRYEGKEAESLKACIFEAPEDLKVDEGVEG